MPEKISYKAGKTGNLTCALSWFGMEAGAVQNLKYSSV